MSASPRVLLMTGPPNGGAVSLKAKVVRDSKPN
jgi:hypothetical protein